jgi:hypothetical protein
VFQFNGGHPSLSAGVLLPTILQCAAEDNARLQADACQLVRFFLNAPVPSNRRPRLPSPATEAVAAQPTITNAKPFPVERCDSDPLCMAFSFLCGCDYYRTLRVCRRWTALLLRPSSWPMRLPCTFHQVALASTIAPLLKADDSIAESACNALVALNEQGVDVLLAQNGLKQLTKLMLRDSPSLQLAAINAVFRCGWVRDGAHSTKLVDCGAFARMLQLCSSPDVHVRGRAMVVVGNVLYGAPEQIDVAFKANILPLVLDEIAAGVLQEAFEDPASLLASVAYRANTAQATVLLQAGALPLLRRYVLNYASDSLRKPPLLRDPLEGKYVMELLKALSNLVSADATVSEAGQVHGSTLSLDNVPHASHAKAAAMTTPLFADERPQVAALLEHWSALVREEAARYLREH